MKNSFKNWQKFYKEFFKNDFQKWPCEPLVRIINGNYLKYKINKKTNIKVLDVGCGFGNNLVLFNNNKNKLYGTEVTFKTAKLTQDYLKSINIDAEILKGTNSKLPFKNNFFDILISINTIHYEKTNKDILKSLKEYNRVLKKNGKVIIFTVGPDHDIFKKAKLYGKNLYQIQNWDFRNGEKYFYFESRKYLEFYSRKFFKNIETGRVTENLMKTNLDFLILAGNK
tara:strand:+ start:2599 stop:3276 length:678 start_codon:yes stop_codon:yes gene_type:complete